MDTSWCLFCGHHIDHELPYCSRECQASDDLIHLSYTDDVSVSDVSSEIIPISLVAHVDVPSPRYTGRDNDGISAWALQIPLSSTAISPPPIEDSAPLLRLEPPTSATTSSSSLRPPKLLLNHTRALPPSLCMSTPKPSAPLPSGPIQAPAQSINNPPMDRLTVISGMSMSTLNTESVATPASGVVSRIKPSGFWSHLATHVRSLVGSSSGISHTKAPARPPQPAIIGINDQMLMPPSKGHTFLSEDDSSVLIPPVAKLKWSLAVGLETDFSDYDSEDDGSFSPPPALKSSPTPTPQGMPSVVRPESSASVLDMLVEDFHPAFQTRGRQMIRCV